MNPTHVPSAGRGATASWSSRPATPARAFLWSSALLGTLCAFVGSGFMGHETLLCLALAALILAPVAVRLVQGDFDIFEPVVVISAVYLLYFVIAPLVRFWSDDMTFGGRNFEAGYLGGLVAVAVAVASMWAGYALPVGPPRAEPGEAAPLPSAHELAAIRRLAWKLVAAALLAMLLWARIAGTSVLMFFLPGILSSGDTSKEGPDIAYFFLAVEWFVPAFLLLCMSGGLRRWPVRIAALLLVTVIYISIAFRYRIVVLWGSAVILAYLSAGARPKLRNLLVPGALAFLFVGWLSNARMYFWSGGAMGGLRYDLTSLLRSSLADTRIFETFIAVTQTVPDFIGFVYLRPFVHVFVQPIPRALFPWKPTPTWLNDIGQSVATPEAGTLGAAVPHFGEYYMAFGWPGVVIGMFLFGMATKWLWRWYRAAPADPRRQVLFAVNTAFLFQVIIRGYLAQIVQEWCFYVLPILLIFHLARRSRPVPAAP